MFLCFCAVWCLIVLSCWTCISIKKMWGQKLKETLVATGSLSECEVVAKRLHTRSVTDTTKEKPVTKQMLKEMWHWDESLNCNIYSWFLSLFGIPCTCALWICFELLYMRFYSVPIFENTCDISKSNDRQCLGVGSLERKGLHSPSEQSRVHWHWCGLMPWEANQEWVHDRGWVWLFNGGLHV